MLTMTKGTTRRKWQSLSQNSAACVSSATARICIPHRVHQQQMAHCTNPTEDLCDVTLAFHYQAILVPVTPAGKPRERGDTEPLQ